MLALIAEQVELMFNTWMDIHTVSVVRQDLEKVLCKMLRLLKQTQYLKQQDY